MPTELTHLREYSRPRSRRQIRNRSAYQIEPDTPDTESRPSGEIWTSTNRIKLIEDHDSAQAIGPLPKCIKEE